VEITHLMGDFIAWPLGDVAKGNQAGVLIGIERTGNPEAWDPTSDVKLVDLLLPDIFCTCRPVLTDCQYAWPLIPAL
jgi:hypothetical protein